MYPLAAPELAGKIEGAIGDGSDFQTMHGYYASSVAPTTAVLPEDWISRAHRIQNDNIDLKMAGAWTRKISSWPRHSRADCQRIENSAWPYLSTATSPRPQCCC